MTGFSEKVTEAVNFLRKNGVASADVAIILGTGLGKLIDHIDLELAFSYEDIPHFPVSTVEFHQGRLIFGTLSGKRVIIMQGRFHYYEGYSMKQIAFPIFIMKALGARSLLVSNACGTMNMDFRKGELILINDHINLFYDNPLIGENNDLIGPRFPDMSVAYAAPLKELLISIAAELGVKLYQGIYCALSGPCLETAAEYRYLRFLGADVVGMSTIPEVITANHIGLPVAAVSVITDECDPDNLAPIDLADILQTAAIAELDLIRLIKTVIPLLDSADNIRH